MIVKLLNQPWSSPSHPSRLLVRFLTHQRDPTCTYYTDKTQNFYKDMKACGSLGSVPIAQKLHAQLICTGFCSSLFLQNHLLHMYFACNMVQDACCVFSEMGFRNVFTFNTMVNGLMSCGRVRDADKVFDEMPERDVVSWNTMMSGYFDNGLPRDSVRVFVVMLREWSGFLVSTLFSCVMKACASIGCLRLGFQLHGLVERFGFSVDGSLIDMYIKCGAVSYAEQVFCRMHDPSLFCWNSMIYGYSIMYGVEGALSLFRKMPERDGVSWSTIVSMLCQHGCGAQALDMFVEMCNRGFLPNSMTYACITSACTSLCDLDWGFHLHARILRMELSLDAYAGSALIDMYAKCGCLDSARRVFDCLAEHSVVSWTSLIAGYVLFGRIEEALMLFNQMRKVPLTPDAFSVATVLGACSSYKDTALGLQLHGYTVKIGIDSLIPLGNALITMYGKVGRVLDAEIEFDLMPVKDIISWTSMITAFSQSSNVKRAREYFDKMPERNVVTWNSMMAAYLEKDFWEECLKLQILMVEYGIKPDSVTFVTSVTACADSALLELGKQILAQAEKSGFASCISVANSAITMYSKCGQIIEAEKFFNSIVVKNVISWNSMMAGYAQNGQAGKVMEMFETMLKLNYTPDDISFATLLTGCSHAGLVEEGCRLFKSMEHDHGICPTFEHYACLVDLLGRAGLVEQALIVIAKMPFKATEYIWGAFLAACRTNRNTKITKFTAKKLLELGLNASGAYSLLANMYSESQEVNYVANIRKMMREKGIQKNPGCSWIEVHNRVHAFTADCRNHPQIADVQIMLDILWKMEHMKRSENMQDMLYPCLDEMVLG